MDAGSPASAAAGGPLGERRLYLCTPDRPDLGDFVAACIRGGVDIVQLREKHLEPRDILKRAEVVRDVCAAAGVPFIFNDRPDLALAAGADGVHVGQDDCPPAVARRILGPGAIIGLSTHAPDQLDASADEPVDYISTGPVVHTATHPDREPTGLGYLTYAAEHSARPFYVTGGASPDTVGDMARAGATRFVAVRWLTEAADPERAARELRTAIETSLKPSD